MVDPEALRKMIDASITRRFESDSRSERPLIAQDIMDGVHYERSRTVEMVRSMIPEWEEREANGASIKQALEVLLEWLSSP